MAAKPGLAWPDHDTGPTPPPEYRSRERDEERTTRKPLALWDRVKFLLLFSLLSTFILSASISENTPLQVELLRSPLAGLGDAIRLDRGTFVGLGLLAAIEFLRQVHYLVSEHWAGYHRFWTRGVFGRADRRLQRMNDWTRFRLGRVLKILFFLFLLDLVLAALLGLPIATALLQAPAAFLSALPFAFQLLFGFFFVIVQFAGLFWFLSRGGIDTYFPDDIKTRFTDVWGQDHVLERVKENIVFLEDPERIEDRGGYVPGGILLWGPPGTGKTLMAEAVAGETGRPYMFIDPGAFINMFMGIGVLKVKSLFRKARKLALRYGGVILFFDEADSLGNRGVQTQGGQVGFGPTPLRWDANGCNGLSYLTPEVRSQLIAPTSAEEPPRTVRDRIMMGGMGGGGGMGTLPALLTELSGLKKPRGFFNRTVRKALGMRPKPPPKYRIMIMMATNLPQALDEALLRPGRIDRIYKVGYPSKAGRIRTYQGYFAKVRHELTDEEVEKLATITPYATGATIKDLVNEALITAIRDGREVITWRDVIRAKQLKALGPPEDVEYIERERHAIAVHEACHAVAAYRMRKNMTIDLATIEKGGSYLGMVSSIKAEDHFTMWRSEYEASVMVSLASLAGERMFFSGDNSSGVSGDLESATSLAMYMEGFWGMGATVASHRVTKEAGIPGGGGKGVDEEERQELLKGSLGERIEDKLEDLLQRTRDLLTENRHEVLAVAHALERHKTISGEDVAAVIEGREGELLDGRPYHTDVFRQAAEDYHTLVADAHQRHAKVEAPLPVLPELAPVGLVPGSANGDSPNGMSPDGSDRSVRPPDQNGSGA